MFDYSSRSIFSRLPNSVKTVWMLVMLTAVFTWPSLVILLLIVILLVVSGYKILDMLKMLLLLLPPVITYLVVFWLFIDRLDVISIAVRMYSVFLIFAWYTYTTDIVSIAQLLKKLKVPKPIYLSFYIMVRFLPEIEHDFYEIRMMQRSRGITLKDPFKYVKAHFVPLIMTLLDKVDELTIAYYLKETTKD